MENFSGEIYMNLRIFDADLRDLADHVPLVTCGPEKYVNLETYEDKFTAWSVAIKHFSPLLPFGT